jgi:hypothetical protein
MTPFGRRKSDRPQTPHGSETERLDDIAAASAWIKRCCARMAQIEPNLAADEADEIAHAMWAFERTGVMEPEAAVDFVVRAMLDETPARFERRGGVATARRPAARRGAEAERLRTAFSAIATRR